MEKLKHGRRESHCGREGVGGHNETGLGYTSHCVARVWLRAVYVSVRSYPLQAVSICAYICVLIGTKTSVVFFSSVETLLSGVYTCMERYLSTLLCMRFSRYVWCYYVMADGQQWGVSSVSPLLALRT